jgi:hypothetical protein
MEVNGQFHAPAALPPGKEPGLPIGREAGWAPGLVWTLCRRRKSLAHPWNRAPAVSPFLYRLTYPESKITIT